MKASMRTKSRDEWTAAKLRAVIEAAPHCMVVINTERQIVLVNLELEKQFGYSPDELVGQSMDILIPKRYRKQQVIQWSEAFTRPRRLTERGVELCARRKDGTEFPALISMRPVKTNGEALLHVKIRD